LETTEAYSLYLTKDGVREGYFPLGFVHGRPEPLIYEGYNLRDHGPRFTRFQETGEYPLPSRLPDDLGSRYFSRINAADAIGGSLLWAVKHGKGALKTKLYGTMQPAIGPDGEPYSRSQILCNVFDPPTRKYLMDYVREHVRVCTAAAFGSSIVLWGLDNEWEGAPNYSEEARQALIPWLARSYADDIAGLNDAWKSEFKDFASAAASQMPAPADYAENPGKFLDWWNFQTDRFTEVLAEMAQTMHEADPRRRGAIHKATQQTIEMPVVNRDRVFDHDLFAQRARAFSGGFYGIDMYGSGDRQSYELSYIDNCIRPLDRQPGYGVMLCETNNHDGPGHQFASTVWRMLPNGLKAVDFFTPGYAGAKGDWDKFGFVDAVTGKPKDKMFYAARWAHMVHRTEKFWTDSVPAPGLPRVAMLMPRLDVLLSAPKDAANRWDYPKNHRWMIYRWLREQGYWVDVIPYSKLTPDFLKEYNALFLVGAEHLTDQQSAAVEKYVADGGVLVADLQPGRYDEHHRLRKSGGLVSLLGTQAGDAPGAKVSLTLDGTKVTSGDFGKVREAGARVLTESPEGLDVAWLNEHGGGRVLSFPFALGSLSIPNAAPVSVGFVAEGPTAVSEDYQARQGEFALGRWLAGLLQKAGVKPGYQASQEWQPKLRVEQPMVDGSGNVAVMVANRAQTLPGQEILPPQSVELSMPAGGWKQAWWASAENDELIPVAATRTGTGTVKVDLPEIATAGVLYFFQNHAPLLGIAPVQELPKDGRGAIVKPGQPFEVEVRVVNANREKQKAGEVRLLALPGWLVAPSVQATPEIAAGESVVVRFTVTPEADSAKLQPDWLYPLVARWSDGAADRAVISANVQVEADLAQVPFLLSGNTKYPEAYPYQIRTNATYRYLAPEESAIADPVKGEGRALQNGFGHPGGQRESRFIDQGTIARYDARQVDILFDLQGERQVRQVKVAVGPDRLVPSSIKVLTSIDGQSFASQGELTLRNTEAVSELFTASARYVRLQVEWPETGGTLDEVEILGK
jgi:hypothetical protein